MLHPLQEDVTSLKDDQLEEKIRELSKKYSIASRHYNQDVLGQMQMQLTTNNEEHTRRLRKQYNNTIATAKEEVETDLNELVNVDKQ